MESEYLRSYSRLNKQQREAVDTIDGPVLVIAGPGTGKTQLLTTRVAHILANTDTLANNILCLTFSEAAAYTMRDRLITIIGRDAYDVTINTYHAFGSDLIRRYPEYFSMDHNSRPVDDLTSDQIFRKIINRLPFNNPLRFSESYIQDIKQFVSDAKQAYLSPSQIKKIARDNLQFILRSQKIVGNILKNLKRIDKQSIGRFHELLTEFQSLGKTRSFKDSMSLQNLLIADLESAVMRSDELAKTTPLTEWKNKWLVKDYQDRFIVDGEHANRKILAAGDIYRDYIDELQKLNYYDYDDMIIQAISALETKDDLRNSIQEKYQYLLLDEFQDTNRAQLKLIELLSNNPVNEGRPNIFAVGDDDQAIYEFQGADYSNMIKFSRLYKDVRVVSLTENYRSTADILHLSRSISNQISSRIENYLNDIKKDIQPAKITQIDGSLVQRLDAKSDVAQFAWIADEINKQKKKGAKLNDIAILAPQHKYLEPLVAFLHQNDISVSYEKRENILDDEIINQLIHMARLCLVATDKRQDEANQLWSEILSYDFWGISTAELWQLSWEAKDNNSDWIKLIIKNKKLKSVGLFFLRLSSLAKSQPLELILDYLVGVTPLVIDRSLGEIYSSPFYDHYFGEKAQKINTGTFWQLLTSLTVLRARLNDYHIDDQRPLLLFDLLDFVDGHRKANLKILNTSPYHEADDAVQLMTVYKAKGQEFKSVFIVSCNDETWGSRSRVQIPKLSLPPNLSFIRYQGMTEDERLRLLYVAITRAKEKLYLVNYLSTYGGKSTTRLKFMDESEKNGKWQSSILPLKSREIVEIEQAKVEPTKELAIYWQVRHQAALTNSNLKQLLKHRLEYYQLSPTHLNNFIDLSIGGPQFFFIHSLLRFPVATNPQELFGITIHETLNWVNLTAKQTGTVPSISESVKTFNKFLSQTYLSRHDLSNIKNRGAASLSAYLSQRLMKVSPNIESEYSFRNENVFSGDAHLSGKIDKLIIDKNKKEITVVDYKTGKSYQKWQSIIKLHRYKQQLYFYKYLVENSRTFRGYKVSDAYLEFIEPDDNGLIHSLHIAFKDQEMEILTGLIKAVWKHVKQLNIPSVNSYGQDLKSIEQFETDLIQNKL